MVETITQSSQVKTVEELMGDDRPIKWVIEGMLPKGHKGMGAGLEGVSKTTLLAWTAICVALGEFMFGMPVKQGAVLMIDEETPTETLERKLHRFCLGFGLKGRHEIPNLDVLSKTGFRFARKNTDITLHERSLTTRK